VRPQFYCRRGEEILREAGRRFPWWLPEKGTSSAGAPSTPGFGVMGWSAPGLGPGLPQFSRLAAPRVPLFAERFYRRRFVVFDVEDGVEFRDLQQVVYFLGEVEQLEFAALVFASGEGADQLADT